MKRLFKIVGLLFCLLSSALAKGQDTGQLRMNKDLPPENDVSLWGGVEEGRFKPTQAALFQWSAGADASVARYGIHTTWTRDFLIRCGHSIQLFPGVTEWFARINAFGESQGVEIEHYVLSSGLKEIIEGSGICHEFKKVYACEFLYDAEGLASWPKLDVNFTNKTQFIYRINKGVLDVSDDRTLNSSMPDDSKRIPFTNMVYIGDGLSDVPCMKMMRSYGGQAIAVYQDSNRQGVEELLSRRRVDFIFPADYREGTDLDLTVKNVIRKMSIADALAEENARQFRQIGQYDLPEQESLFD